MFQFIVPPPDLTITIPHFCHYCEQETEWRVEFLAWSIPDHAVSYNIICEQCESERPIPEKIAQWLPTNEWLDMLSDIKILNSN